MSRVHFGCGIKSAMNHFTMITNLLQIIFDYIFLAYFANIFDWSTNKIENERP
jgi:hypothetical protein